jgi:glycosyltransferase involved in cell wall biosynthesis
VRIAVVHNLKPGGAHRRLRSVVRNLPGELVEVTLSTAAPVTQDPIVVPLQRRASSARRSLRPLLRYTDLGELARSWRRVQQAIAQASPDVVFANACQFLGSPPVAGPGCPPVVYHCDEPRRVFYEHELRSTVNPMTRPLYLPMYRAEKRWDRGNIRHAAVCLTNSEYAARRIAEAYDRPATVIPCGVDAFFRPHETSSEPLHLLSVGTLIPSKGHHLAIEAAALARSRWPVMIVSPRPNPAEEARLRAVAERLGVRLEVRTGIPEEDLRSAYRCAFAVLYMAEREPLGLASLEAQACGVPVVVSAEGGLPETIQEGVTGWAVARNAAAVAGRLDRLFDSDQRDAMAKAAASFARALTWRSSAAQIATALGEAAR